jgi:hypothetical protein
MVSDRKHVPFNYGDHIPPNGSVGGRDIELTVDVGSMLIGASNTPLVTAHDLETERTQLSFLQRAGRQPLWCTNDRYCLAYLSEFDNAPFQDGGLMRYSTWDLKFIADDPRYYSTNPNTYSIDPITDNANHAFTISHAGNIRAYPKIIITCHGTDNTVANGGIPQIGMSSSLGSLNIKFSLLAMYDTDQLIIDCDPRPEHRSQAAIYYHTGQSINALKYIQPTTDLYNDVDFSEVFPYVEAAVNDPGTQTFAVRMQTGTPNYSFAISWNDTWL